MKPTFDELIVAVTHMREWQKAWADTPKGTEDKKEALMASIRAETRVDKMLEALNSPQEALL
jgi:hypothetical protein